MIKAILTSFLDFILESRILDIHIEPEKREEIINNFLSKRAIDGKDRQKLQ